MQNEINIANLYDQSFEKIYKFFYYKVLSKEIAEDLTSETFMTFAGIIKNKREIEKPEHFLYGIAKNIFMKYLKQKYQDGIPFSNFGEDFEEYVGTTVEETEKRENLEDKIAPFINMLPEKQRLVITMRLIEKLSLGEICTKLQKDMNYVKTTQKRAMKSLKILVETSE